MSHGISVKTTPISILFFQILPPKFVHLMSRVVCVRVCVCPMVLLEIKENTTLIICPRQKLLHSLTQRTGKSLIASENEGIRTQISAVDLAPRPAFQIPLLRAFCSHLAMPFLTLSLRTRSLILMPPHPSSSYFGSLGTPMSLTYFSSSFRERERERPWLTLGGRQKDFHSDWHAVVSSSGSLLPHSDKL